MLATAALFLCGGASHAADRPEGESVRHVVLRVGESFGASATGIRNYSYQDQGGVASLQVGADEFRLRALQRGQSALVLIDTIGRSQLIVVDVEANTGAPPPLAANSLAPSVPPTPAASPAPIPPSKSVRNDGHRADRSREMLKAGDYTGARALLLGPVTKGTASYEEMFILKATCTVLRDAPCAETAKRLLRGHEEADAAKAAQRRPPVPKATRSSAPKPERGSSRNILDAPL